MAARVAESALLASVVGAAAPRVAEAAVQVAYKTVEAAQARVAEGAVLVAHSSDTQARAVEGAVTVAYKTGVSGLVRSRAWTYTLDGHVFYVLNLAEEGTFVYDDSTGQWAQFQTGGYGIWNMINGTDWGVYTVGGDAIFPTVWALSPDGVLDEDWRPVEHKVNGALPSRVRAGVPLDELMLTISSGFIGEDGAVLQMRFSDNQGRTWSAYYDITLTQADYDQSIQWLSLGLIASPGRVFEIRDVGGMIRLDDCTAVLNGKDDG